MSHTDSTVLCLPHNPTEDQQHIARLGQREQLQVAKKWDVEVCWCTNAKERDDQQNHIDFKWEMTQLDTTELFLF